MDLFTAFTNKALARGRDDKSSSIANMFIEVLNETLPIMPLSFLKASRLLWRSKTGRTNPTTFQLMLHYHGLRTLTSLTLKSTEAS